MPLQGTIDPDHIPVNKYELAILGLGSVTFTKVSGLETELGVIDLPDRTRATGGQKGASELTVEVPMHHTDEIALMDSWFDDGQDPVAPNYKKPGTLQHLSNTRNILKEYALEGVWCSKRKLPDLDMANDGEQAIVEYTLQADIVTPI
jgi:hypothetical protein